MRLHCLSLLQNCTEVMLTIITIKYYMYLSRNVCEEIYTHTYTGRCHFRNIVLSLELCLITHGGKLIHKDLFVLFIGCIGFFSWKR